MRHPIYKPGTEKVRDLSKVLLNRTKLDLAMNNLMKIHGSVMSTTDSNALITTAIIYNEIMNGGHNFIQINGNDWSSEVSEKSLEKIRLRDINLPFHSGTVVTDTTTMHFAYLSKDKIKKYEWDNGGPVILESTDTSYGMLYISVTKNNDKSVWYITLNDEDYLFDRIKEDEFKELLSILISVLIYTGIYRDKVDRVSSKKVVGEKSSKLSIPKHNINVINLKQKVKYSNNDSSGNSWSSRKRWIVRGHIRNQYYKTLGTNKPIWIDPYWKGEGAEEISKVYKIT